MPVSTRQSARPKLTSSETPPSNTAFLSQSSLSSKLVPLNAYNLTTPLLIFFAVTHTVAGLILPNDFGVEADATFSAMQSVRFNFMGSLRTLHDFYMGFGLGVTIFLCMSTALSWVLSVHPNTNMSRSAARAGTSEGEAKHADDGDSDGNEGMRSKEDIREKEFVRMLKWIPFLNNFANMLLCYVYFFVPPMVVSTLVAALMGWECFKDWKY